MHSTTFPVSPKVKRGKPLSSINHREALCNAFRQRIEAMWSPPQPLVSCSDDHALISAVNCAFFEHYPLRLSPDVIWLTLARGFALHVNLHAEELRRRFVAHEGKCKIVVDRPDFLPGRENPWPEAFAEFSTKISPHVGKLRDFVRCDFSTTGPMELAVSDIMLMDTFQAYFEYKMLAGCGIPEITLLGTVDDWKSIRTRAALFGEFGLEEWSRALDPVLAQFVAAAHGSVDAHFWQSMFRYSSGSGPSVMTGWINVLFPYLRHNLDDPNSLYPNPYLDDWQQRLTIDESQGWREKWDNPQGVGMRAIPTCRAAAPVKVIWGSCETEMFFVGGLLGVSQDPRTLALEPQCGWAVVYDDPLGPL